MSGKKRIIFKLWVNPQFRTLVGQSTQKRVEHTFERVAGYRHLRVATLLHEASFLEGPSAV